VITIVCLSASLCLHRIHQKLLIDVKVDLIDVKVDLGPRKKWLNFKSDQVLNKDAVSVFNAIQKCLVLTEVCIL